MCKKTKKLRFKWEFGDEMVSLHVNQYAYGGRLHIGMINYGEDGPEPFADMTVNLPAYEQRPVKVYQGEQAGKGVAIYREIWIRQICGGGI